MIADGLLGDRCAVDVVEVCRNFPRGQSFRREGQNDLVDPGQASLPFLDDLRVERGIGVPWYLDLYRSDFGEHGLRPPPVPGVFAVSPRDVVLLIAEVLVHLGFECGFQDVRGELVEQSVWADQLDTFGFRLRQQLLGQLLVVDLRLIHRIECFGHCLAFSPS